MASDFYPAALENLARAYEATLDTSLCAVVKKRIYILGNFLPGGPGTALVIAPEHSHPVRIATVGFLFPVHSFAANSDKQQLISIPVPHNGRVAETAVHGSALPCPFYHDNLIRPGPAIVRRNLRPDVNAAEAYIRTAMPVVNDSRERPVIERSQCRNPVRHPD